MRLFLALSAALMSAPIMCAVAVGLVCRHRQRRDEKHAERVVAAEVAKCREMENRRTRVHIIGEKVNAMPTCERLMHLSMWENELKAGAE